MIFPWPVDAWPKHPDIKALATWKAFGRDSRTVTFVEVGTDLAMFPDQPGYDKAKADAPIGWVSKTIMGRGEVFQTTIRRIEA